MVFEMCPISQQNRFIQNITDRPAAFENKLLILSFVGRLSALTLKTLRPVLIVTRQLLLKGSQKWLSTMSSSLNFSRMRMATIIDRFFVEIRELAGSPDRI